mmetsp:Transcript_14180/g.36570  ORF Transcript_14180/g.36570 Transcript_14180/m.36570 type:complete len:249 (-) Transcript_14180:562-1308(-)
MERLRLVRKGARAAGTRSGRTACSTSSSAVSLPARTYSKKARCAFSDRGLSGGLPGRRQQDVRVCAKSRPLKPDDSPLRDGNRDRLLGLLTRRAARTLLFYCSETNQHLYNWLNDYIKEEVIPNEGQFEDVSGETFLMKLMLKPAVQVRAQPWVDPIFDCSKPLTVDPRQVAQRIMDIRVALAKEFQEDLKRVDEENMELLKRSLMASLDAKTVAHPVVPSPEEDAAAAEDGEATDKEADTDAGAGDD